MGAAVTGNEEQGRKRALRTALILALVALAFYAGIFLLVGARHF